MLLHCAPLGIFRRLYLLISLMALPCTANAGFCNLVLEWTEAQNQHPELFSEISIRDLLDDVSTKWSTAQQAAKTIAEMKQQARALRSQMESRAVWSMQSPTTEMWLTTRDLGPELQNFLLEWPRFLILYSSYNPETSAAARLFLFAPGSAGIHSFLSTISDKLYGISILPD